MWFTEGYPLTGIPFGSKLGRMKPTFLALLLVPSLAFAQKPSDIKFQDASAKGAPGSLFAIRPAREFWHSSPLLKPLIREVSLCRVTLEQTLFSKIPGWLRMRNDLLAR